MVWGLRPVDEEPVRLIELPANRVARDRFAARSRPVDGTARTVLLEELSREVRTTLALVSGYSQTLLHMELDDSERRRYLTRISIASEHVAELSEEMLSVTSQNAGEPLRQAVAIGTLIGQLGRQLAEEADPPSILAQLPAELPLVSADPVWIVTMLRILVATMASGGADGHLIRLDARSTAQWVVVSARAGEEPSRAGRQGAHPALRAPIVPARSGVRLGDVRMRPGLDFCRELVEAHGGRIWLDETASGVRVSFCLQRYWPEEKPIAEGGTRSLLGAFKP